MLTREQAGVLIDYLETLEERSNHQTNMAYMEEKGFAESEIDEACKALGAIAGRTYGIL